MTFLDFANMNPEEFVVILILIGAISLIYFSVGVFIGITWFKNTRTPEEQKAEIHQNYYGDFWERKTP